MEENQAIKGNIVWIAGGLAVLLIIGLFFAFRIFGQKNYKLTLIDAPKEVTAEGFATFTWRIDGPSTTINHTSVHYGVEATSGELGEDTAPQDTKYTDLIQDFAQGEFTIPLQFVGNAKVGPPGTYYFRVHAVIDDKNYWSDEYTLDVIPAVSSIAIVDAPEGAVVGVPIAFTWNIGGPPTTINHTAIYYGLKSTPGDLGKDVVPEDTDYTEIVDDFADGEYNVPLRFVGNKAINEAGTYYFRAHAVINDEHFWTDEFTVDVVEADTEAETEEEVITKIPTETPTEAPAEAGGE